MARQTTLATLAVLVTVSCGGPKPASKQAPEPVADTGPKPAPVGEDPREILLRETLERVRVIQDEVAALRGLRFSHPVPAERQTVADFRRVLIREIEKVFPTRTSRRMSKALFHLGVLKEKTDLATAMVELSVGQVAAYYNPETGKFYAVTLSDNREWLEVMTAHELVHGLQDQNFDLRHYVGEPSPNHAARVKLSEDQINARRFVVEGEASVMMWVYKAAKALEVEVADTAVMIQTRALVAMMGSMSWQTMAEQADAEANLAKKKATRLGALPPFLIAPTFESYTNGAKAVFIVQQDGGWEAVSALFTDPPDSTEQVLHPTEKLLGDRDRPTVVTIPDFSKRFGEALTDDTLGELGWRVYLETWEVPAADEAAAGWDGDRIAVYETPDGPVGLLAFVWDSENEAIEFENAFRRSLRARTNKGSDPGSKDVARYVRSDGSEILVRRDGDKLFVVDGAVGTRADTFLSTLESAATFTPMATEKSD